MNELPLGSAVTPEELCGRIPVQQINYRHAEMRR